MNRVVKTWALNTEVGKGSKNHATDQSGVQFGSYSYPFRVYGEPLLKTDGTEEYLDENGVGRTAFLYSAWPGDKDYAAFEKSVPEPRVAAADNDSGPETETGPAETPDAGEG